MCSMRSLLSNDLEDGDNSIAQDAAAGAQGSWQTAAYSGLAPELVSVSPCWGVFASAATLSAGQEVAGRFQELDGSCSQTPACACCCILPLLCTQQQLTMQAKCCTSGVLSAGQSVVVMMQELADKAACQQQLCMYSSICSRS